VSIGLKISKRSRRVTITAAAWDRRASLAFGKAIVARVVVRAFTRGLGSDDQPHKPYSKGYLATRLRSGRSGKVDLTWTGALHRSIRVQAADARRIVVGMSGSAARYGTHVNSQRPFMQLSPRDSTFLAKVARRLMRDALKRARGVS